MSHARAPALVLAALLVGVPAALVPGPAAAMRAASQQDVTIASFDGVHLAATVFVPAGSGPFPVVLRTHGWAGNRETNPGGTIQALLDRGIAVLTWDSRGFGQSQGQVELDSPDYEVRDVGAILDWLGSGKAPFAVRLDGPNDPRAGMSGGSYAGGIQLLSAALDPRIDAIAPEITWNDLADSLAPNGVLKLGWVALLYASGEVAGYLGTVPPDTAHLYPNTDGVDPVLTVWLAESLALNGLSPDAYAALERRSPATHIGSAARFPPTLLVQGERDTLFTPDEAVKNLRMLQAKGVPAQLLLHGGGHGYATPDAGFVQQRVAGWLDFWLQGHGSVPAQPVTVYHDWDQSWASLPAWPTLQGERLYLSTFLAQLGAPAEPGLGPQVRGCLCPPGLAAPGQVVLANSVAPSTHREVPNFNDLVPVPPTEVPLTDAVFEDGRHVAGALDLTGAARLHLVVTAPPDAELFVKITDSDEANGIAFAGNQVTPLRMPSLAVPPGTSLTHTFDVDLVGMVHRFAAGHHRGISISTTDDAFSGSRVPGPVVLELGQSWVSFPTA